MRTIKTLIIFLSLVCVIAFTVLDAFQELNVTKEDAEYMITNSITSGLPSVPSKARTIAMANRAAIVQAVGTFTKSYVKTDHFKAKYAEWWKSMEPTKPATPEEKAAERKKQEVDGKKSQEEAMANMKKQMDEAKDPATKKMYKEMIESTNQMTASFQTPEFKESMKEAAEMMAQMDAEQYKTGIIKYEEEMKEWQSKKDPTAMIKEGLQKFLDETEGIDFNAQLTTDQYGRKLFVNEEYEAKGGYWKQAFRAGKPTVDMGRTMAKQWLEELK